MSIKTFTAAQKDEKISKYFYVDDFWAYSEHTSIKLDTQLAYIWDMFYEEFGVKPRLRNKYKAPTGKYSPVSSAGYRNKQNWTGSKTSQHCYGRGVDMEVPGVPAYKLAQFAEEISKKMGIGGIGHYWTTSGGDVFAEEHIHIDTRSRSNPSRWGYQNKTSGCNIPSFGGIIASFKKGSQGVGVALIQKKLNELGYNVGQIDGSYGRKTVAAVTSFQEDNGLKADGIFGKGTNQKMRVFDW